jgi:hypothetical protein
MGLWMDCREGQGSELEQTLLPPGQAGTLVFSLPPALIGVYFFSFVTVAYSDEFGRHTSVICINGAADRTNVKNAIGNCTMGNSAS